MGSTRWLKLFCIRWKLCSEIRQFIQLTIVVKFQMWNCQKNKEQKNTSHWCCHFKMSRLLTTLFTTGIWYERYMRMNQCRVHKIPMGNEKPIWLLEKLKMMPGTIWHLSQTSYGKGTPLGPDTSSPPPPHPLVSYEFGTQSKNFGLSPVLSSKNLT